MSDVNAAAGKVPFESLTPEEQRALAKVRERRAAEFDPRGITWDHLLSLVLLADRLVADPVPVIEDGVYDVDIQRPGAKPQATLFRRDGEWFYTATGESPVRDSFVVVERIGDLPSRLREANTDAETGR